MHVVGEHAGADGPGAGRPRAARHDAARREPCGHLAGHRGDEPATCARRARRSDRRRSAELRDDLEERRRASSTVFDSAARLEARARSGSRTDVSHDDGDCARYLEMREPSSLRAGARCRSTHPRRARRTTAPPRSGAFSIPRSAAAYRWVDRLAVDRRRDPRAPRRSRVSIWLMTVKGTPAGYFELQRRCRRWRSRSPTSACFDEFTGRGLGGHLLTARAETRVAAGRRTRVAAHLLARSSGGAAELPEARASRVFKTKSTGSV